METKQKLTDKYPILKILGNRYLIVLVFFVVWITFVDTTSYMEHRVLNKEIEELEENKKYYKNFIESLVNVLPCKYCRINLKNNLKAHPIRPCHMKNRETFSRYIYTLHEIINKMLGKKSGLSYCEVRERYEHFRSRCTQNDAPKIFKFDTSSSDNKEKGCTEPLYGEKAKCVIQIVPEQDKTPSFVVDDKCIKVKVGGT